MKQFLSATFICYSEFMRSTSLHKSQTSVDVTDSYSNILFIIVKPCIIFVDEIDAIGVHRFSEGTSADREIQQTLMELLNQSDGLDQLGKVCLLFSMLLTLHTFFFALRIIVCEQPVQS